MNKKLKYGLAVVLAVLIAAGVYWFFVRSEDSTLTAVDCSVDTCFTTLGVLETLAVDGATSLNSTVTNAGAVTNSSTLTQTGAATFTADATFNGGDNAVTITTTNSATSTLDVGCIQTTATSTLTPVRLVLSSAGTTTATFGAGTANGGVSWQYGSCPI